MKYYPKSQLKTDLYTKGNEFVTSQTNLPYKGYYWGVSTGEFFSGKNPEDRPSYRLSPISSVNQDTLRVEQSPASDDSNSYYIPDSAYNNAKNIPLNAKASSHPKQSITIPTTKDYESGYMMRYFLKKNNEYKYIEISSLDYSKYQAQLSTVPFELYTPLSIKWDLKSNNQYSITYIENSQGWYGFSTYFKGKF